MTWERCLINQAKAIINHTDGELNLVARPHGNTEVKIIIKAGKSWSFIVKRYEEED